MSKLSSRLEVHLLGAVEIQVDGQPLVVDTKKAVALLAYLVVTGREHSRDHLCDLLWPETDPDRARATLRRTLSALRSGLGDRWVTADRSRVVFEPGGALVDVDEFSAAADHTHGADTVCRRCVGTLGDAGRFYRGPFMDGFALRGCPAFDDWMLAQDQVYRRKAATVFERLSIALASEGRYAEAMDSVRRWLEIDDLHERAHRSLMLLQAWSGDRAGAVDTYRTCAATLDRELGVEPLDETTELYEAILEDDLPRAPARPRQVAPDSGAAGTYPLVGRQAELDRLRAVVRAGAGLVILEGELGVGKTRLLDELHREVIATGRTMLIGRAHRTESGVPYGPIHAVLTEAFDRPEARRRIHALPHAVIGEVARLLPALGPVPEDDPRDATARARFLDAMAQAIGALDDGVVVAVDNVHWADAATVELVGHLARRLAHLRVVLIVTRRPEDTPIDHPVALLMEDLAAEADVIRLDRLPSEAVTQLVEGTGLEGLDPSVVHQRTGGLPFFVVEYLEAAKSGHDELPVAIRRLLLGRISELDDVGRQLLATAAAIGMTADPGVLAAVSGRSEDEVVVGLDELVRRSMLREERDGTLAFVHEQMRDVAYEQMTVVRRRLLHRRAATHLMSLAGADGDPRLLAAAVGHHHAGGNDAAAAELAARAGEYAAAVFAFDDAAAHFDNAIALGHPNRASLNHRIGDLQTLSGRYGAALLAYERAMGELAEGSAEVAVIAQATGEVYRRLGRWEIAAACFSEAWEASADPVLRSAIAADWAYVLHRTGDEDQARALAHTALEHAATSEHSDAIARAHNLAALVAVDHQVAFEYLQRALEHAERPAVRAAVLNNMALSLARSGDVAGAIVHGRKALELAILSGDRHKTAALHDNLADFLHAAGEDDSSMSELKEAVTLFADVGLQPGELEPEIWLLKEW